MAAPMSRFMSVKTSRFLRKFRIINSRWGSSITGNDKADKALQTLTGGRFGSWLERYEDVVGLTEVKEAQTNVLQAEKSFLEVQNERRFKQQEASAIQSKIKEIHSQLDKVERGDERYLALLTEEYQVLKDEKSYEEMLRNLEEDERSKFSALSSAVRESHEKERSRTERTKYWSVIGSVIGAIIGITGTSLNNYLRMRELRKIVVESASDGVELKGIVAELSDESKSQHKQIHEFITDLKRLLGQVSSKEGTKNGIKSVYECLPEPLTEDKLEEKAQNIIDMIQKQDEVLNQELADLKRLLNASGESAPLDNSDWKITKNTLWAVTFLYGTLALSIPILYNVFKGS